MLPDPRRLLVGLAVLVPALAGCMTGPAVQVDVPAPTIGAEYVYEGPAGQLNVTVRRTGQHYDGVFRVHRTVVLNVTIPDPTREASCNKIGKIPICYLGEAVAPAGGLVVQQWNKCGMNARPPPQWCAGPRAVVLFDGGGLPGGFGAAPFWSDTVETEETTVRVAPLTYDRRALDYTVEPANRDGCVRLEGIEALDKYGLQTLPLAVVAGPIVLCQDRSLPVRFTTVTGDTYTLQEHRPGERTVEAENGPTWMRPGHPFPRRSWTEPFVVSERERTRLSLQEAHQIALDDSPAYRRLFEESAHPFVVATDTSVPTSGRGPVPGGVGDSKTYQRGLVAVASDGRGVNVTVEKTIHEGPQPNETRVVEEVNVSMEPTPTRATLPDRLVSLDDVARVAEAISGLPLDIKGWTGVGPTLFPGHYPITEATNFHFETNFDWRWGLTDSLTIVPWLLDPDPEGALSTPYYASADAASGHLEAIEVNRTRMPLADPPPLPWADGT